MNPLIPDITYNWPIREPVFVVIIIGLWLGTWPEVGSEISSGRQNTAANLGAADDCAVISLQDSRAGMSIAAPEHRFPGTL